MSVHLDEVSERVREAVQAMLATLGTQGLTRLELRQAVAFFCDLMKDVKP